MFDVSPRRVVGRDDHVMFHLSAQKLMMKQMKPL